MYSILRKTTTICLVIIICQLGYGQCDPADASFICVSSINASGPGKDNIVICNNSSTAYNLIGVMVVDSDPTNETTVDIMIPALSCVTLDEDFLDFKFSGGGDSFTIKCMNGTEFLSVSYSETDAEGFAILPNACDPPIGACDPTLAAGTLFVLSVDPSGGTDDVEICNNSASVVSISGTFGSDDPAEQDEEINNISVPAFGCVIISGDFDLSENNPDEFFLTCEGVILTSLAYDPADFPVDADGDPILPFTPPGVSAPVAPAAGIPTMGEWGLMSLGLLFLIFGTIKIKEENLLIA